MRTTAIAILVLLLCTATAWGGSVGSAVDVRIATDEGRILPTYPVKVRRGVHKVYAEAVKGNLYRIEVKNRLNRRIGLVIAVDGRNIISGEKSWLKNTERMYILEPYGSGEFAGWRTAQDRINRFYFTDVPDSYASAFGDESAMGVIAVAVYPEVRPCKPPAALSQVIPRMEPNHAGKPLGAADRAAKAEAAAPAASGEVAKRKGDHAGQMLESAGTGYGRDEYSPSEVVAFEPEKRSLETIYLKYEWRSTLCRLGIAGCAGPLVRMPNRLWDQSGYAPPPPLRGTHN